ncbi:MAG: hypothetical protein V5A34_03590 [Halapricum sp.]
MSQDIQGDEDSTVYRRSILQGSAGAIGTTAFSTAAAGQTGSLELRQQRLEARQELPQEYDAESAAAAFEKYADPLLKELASEGLIDSPSIDAFEPVDEPAAAGLDAEAKTVKSSKLAVEGDVHEGSGSKTAVISARKTRGDDAFVYALPEVEFAYAIVQSDDGRMYADSNDPTLNSGATIQGNCTGDLCRKDCNSVFGAYVIRSQSGGTCANTCTDWDPSCDECPDQNKCSNW